jgi:integrase
MPGQRYQDPKIHMRSDVARPFYYIQPYVPELTPNGVKRLRKNIQLGFCDEMTMRQAKSRKEQIMATINAGRFVLQSQIPFTDVVKRFEENHIPTLGSAARERYPIQIRNHILPTFKGARMCDITQQTVQQWINTKAELSWWTRSDLRGILSGIFTKAKEWRLFEGENPCHGVGLGRKKDKRAKHIPAKDDLEKFLEAIPENCLISEDGARLIVITAVVSGLRLSEVLGLTPIDIDANGETLRVERRWRRGDEGEPKTEASRRVRQIGSLAGELLEYASSNGRKRHEYIFLRKDGRPLDDRDLQRDVFRPAAEAVSIYHEGFGMHVFRRLNVTWRQTIGGATPTEAQKQAGHTSLDMTMLYTQTEEEREREQVSKILEHIGRAKKTAAKAAETLERMTAAGGVQ